MWSFQMMQTSLIRYQKLGSFHKMQTSLIRNWMFGYNYSFSCMKDVEKENSLDKKYTESVVAIDDDHSLLTKMNSQSSQSKVADGLPESSSFGTTPEIERRYVHSVYDAIAPHFSSTRFAKWPKVASFLDSLAPGSVVVDTGCGNGKYLGVNSACVFIGCDIVPSLVSICACKGHEVHVADTLSLPYRTGCYDAAISIAVLHHLSTEERRKKAVAELLRVVRKGGKILITVWAVEQEDRSLLKKWTPLTCKYTEEWVDNLSHQVSISPFVSLESIKEKDYSLEVVHEKELQEQDAIERRSSYKQEPDESRGEQQEYFVPWHLPYHRPEVKAASSMAISTGLGRVDDKKRAVIYNRYYHVFVEGELERLVSSVKDACIVDHFYDKSNWCVILEKL